MATLRVGDPLDKSTDIGAIVADVQLERIRKLVEQGRAEGADLLPAGLGTAERRALLSADARHRRRAGLDPGAGGDFRPGARLDDVPHAGRGAPLANNSRYGLAASVWSESINVTLDAAARVKAGVVWVNSTNLFDAAAGFGGYKESGFGREGGREGLFEYLVPSIEKKAAKAVKSRRRRLSPARRRRTLKDSPGDRPPLDRTAKLYIGGKQARPDSGYSYAVYDASGEEAGQAGLGNRKDIRNAVEAAHKAGGWGSVSGHNRAQVLYYLAENLEARAEEFGERIATLTGVRGRAADEEVAQAIRRISFYAAHADKYDGHVHATRSRHVTLAMNEPWGVMGISCPDEAPLLALVSLVAPAIAMGNRVVVTPSPVHPLVATDFYQVLDTSDVPAGVVNIVTGDREALAKTIAEHDDIAAYWYFGTKEGSAKVEAALGREPQGDLGQSWPRGRLGERRRRPGPPLPSSRNAGEEHLGALRRIALCSPLISTWQERMGARSTAAISTEDKVRFLSAPEAYPAKPAEVEMRETHWSYVFLAGERAYKLKKPLASDHFDHTRVAAREANCRKEVLLNRRLAGDVYHGVARLVLTADGRLAIDGAGATIDWLVVMRRLPHDRMLDRMIAAGTFEFRHLERLGRRLATFYAGRPAAKMRPSAYLDRFRSDQADNRVVLAACRTVPPDRYARLLDRLAAALAGEGAAA